MNLALPKSSIVLKLILVMMAGALSLSRVLFYPPSIRAADKQETFDATLITTYQVETSGVATVEHAITITNITPTTYVKQYALTLATPNQPAAISVTSNDTTLQPNVVATDRQTSIAVTFPDQLVGEGKQHRLIIRYQDTHSVTITGSILEIRVPTLLDTTSFSSHQVQLITPLHFGQPTATNPNPSHTEVTETTSITTFNQPTQAITALYGTTQFYAGQLKYALANTSPTTNRLQIALPPDTNHQRLTYTHLEPRPKEILPDQDGNWIATYELKPHENLFITAQFNAQVTLEPQQLNAQSTALPNHYLDNHSFWEVDDYYLNQQTAPLNTAREIYEFVVSTLHYPAELTTQHLERQGAMAALRNPDQATCQEFTDVFIALARNRGIPARRLTGYAYTQNQAAKPLSFLQDELHAWPEYFDAEQNRWVPIDPTWGSTTGGVDYFHQFDLNHLVFAINGISSSLPFPAGAYKLPDQDSQDVVVEFDQQLEEVAPDIEITWQPKSILGISIPGWYEVSIKNQTGRAWYDIRVTVQDQQGRSVSGGVTDSARTTGITAHPNQISLTSLLPFQEQHYQVFIAHNNSPTTSEGWWPQTTTISTTLILNDNHNPNSSTIHHVKSGPAIISPLITRPHLTLGLVIGGVSLTLGAGSLLVSRRKRAGAIRW